MPGGPVEEKPLRGVRLALALAWAGGVVLLYLAVRELGLGVVP